MLLLCGGCSKEAKKNRFLAAANKDFSAGQFDKAEIEYLKVLQIAPANPVAFTRLGFIYQDQGRFPQALLFLKRAAELDPENPELRLKLCLTELSLLEFKNAREDASRLLQKQPGQEDALLVLAETTFSLKDVQDTTAQIETLRKQDKDRPGYHLAVGTLYFRQGQLSNAAPEFDRALSLDPKLPATHLALGNLYWMGNDLVRADQSFKTAADLSPLRSPRRLKYAEFKLKTGSLDDAKKLLEDLTHNAPDYLPAWNYLAQVAFAERRFDDAAALLQKVLARDRINYDATLLDANVKLNKNQIPQAIDQLLSLSKTYEQAPDIQLRLGQIYLLNGDNAKAEASFKRALSLSPNFPDAIIALADLSIQKGDPASAVSPLEQLIRRRPEIPQAHLLLAAAYASQNNLDQTLAVYRRMQPMFANSPQVPWLMATVLARLNEPAEARKACDQSLKLAPDFLPPLEQLVDLDLADKNPQAALDRVNQQIERRPSVPELILLQAKIYLAQKDFNQAEADLLKVIQLAPDLRTGYLMLAQLYVASNKTQEALARLNGFVARTNDVPALTQLGMLQESLTNYPAAREAYEKILTVNPKSKIALNNLAFLYYEYFNELDKAALLAEHARQLFPGDYSVADTLGWICYRKADYPRALSMLTQSAAGLPNDPEIQYHLGMVRYALGQETSSRMALENSLKGEKDFPGKAEARRRLAILALDSRSTDSTTQSRLEKRLAEDPNDSIALVRLATIYEHNGLAEKAAKTCQQALVQNPKNAGALGKLAQLYSAPNGLNNPQKALQYAKDAHALVPDDAAISQLLGHLVFEARDYKWASSLLQDAALKSPDQPLVLYDLAQSYYGLGQLTPAETAMQNALKTGSSFSHTEEARRFLSLLAAYRDPAQRPALASELQTTLKADPKNIPALMVSAQLQQEHASYSDAKKTLEQVLALNPLFAPATRDLAILCFEHFPDESRTYDLALKARDTFPDDPNLAKVLGVLAFRRANYSAAAQYLKQSIQARNNDGELFYYLGMAEYQLKSKTESKVALQQAVALNIQAKLADEARRVLAELK